RPAVPPVLPFFPPRRSSDLFGTVYAAVIALVIAVPFSIGVALFIAIYAPRSIAAPVAYVIDLLAAVPSVIFGIWGAFTLAKHLTDRKSTRLNSSHVEISYAV